MGVERVTAPLTDPMAQALFESNLVVVQSHPCKIALYTV